MWSHKSVSSACRVYNYFINKIRRTWTTNGQIIVPAGLGISFPALILFLKSLRFPITYIRCLDILVRQLLLLSLCFPAHRYPSKTGLFFTKELASIWEHILSLYVRPLFIREENNFDIVALSRSVSILIKKKWRQNLSFSQNRLRVSPTSIFSFYNFFQILFMIDRFTLFP